MNICVIHYMYVKFICMCVYYMPIFHMFTRTMFFHFEISADFEITEKHLNSLRVLSGFSILLLYSF